MMPVSAIKKLALIYKTGLDECKGDTGIEGQKVFLETVIRRNDYLPEDLQQELDKFSQNKDPAEYLLNIPIFRQEFQELYN